MENKLYFEPANFGKGKKKEQKGSESGDNKRFLKLTGFLIFLLVIGGIIFWFLRGKTTVSGDFPANIGAESLTCSKENAIYEKINYAGGDKKHARITAIFDGSETLRTLSFNYSLIFSSDTEVKAAEGTAHYSFARYLADDGLDFTEFENKFSIIGNELIISLFVEQAGINNKSAPYFMLEDVPTDTLSGYRDSYESLGFSCSSTIDNK